MAGMTRLAAGATCAALLCGAAAAEDDKAEVQRKTRELGLSIGNTHVCVEGEERELLKADWQMIYDLIVKDVGSDLGFVFATASGYGASLGEGGARLPRPARELEAHARGIRPRGGRRMMRRAAPLLGLALLLGLASGPSRAATPPTAMPRAEAGAETAGEAPVLLARCGPECRAKRRAWRRHYRPHRPHRPPHYRPRPHYPHHYHRRHRRDDAAAAAIIGGIIGLGIGAAIANSAPDYYDDGYAPEFADPGGGR